LPDIKQTRLPALSQTLSLSNGSVSKWFTNEVQPHEKALRAYLHGRLSNFADVDDLVQETYVRMFRARQKYSITSVKAMLFAVARNVAFDLFRHEKVISIESMADLERLSVLEDRPDAAEAASREQELELLREAIQQLPARCRAVFALRKIHGCSLKEISAQLDLSVNTVSNQLKIGHERCRQFLALRGVKGVGDP
jgi:RNA polymerase sigma-70 factor (ECF subfamily)